MWSWTSCNNVYMAHLQLLTLWIAPRNSYHIAVRSKQLEFFTHHIRILAHFIEFKTVVIRYLDIIGHTYPDIIYKPSQPFQNIRVCYPSPLQSIPTLHFKTDILYPRNRLDRAGRKKI